MKTSKILAMVLCLVLCLSLFAVSVFAETAEADGLKLTLTTDKAEYAVDEQIVATLKVENNSASPVKNVSLKIEAPDALAIAAGAAEKNIAQLAAGASDTLEATYKVDAPAQTGDSTPVFVLIIAAIVSCAIIVLMFVNRRTACMALALVMVLGLGAIAVPANAASDSKSVETSVTVKVADTDMVLKAIATYEIEVAAGSNKFETSKVEGGVTADKPAGTLTLDGTGNTQTVFAASAEDATANKWEFSGSITKNDVSKGVFLSFGVIDANGKEQWFCIFEDSVSLNKAWPWADTKQPVDDTNVIFNQAACSFFWKEANQGGQKLNYKLVLEGDVLKAYFGNDKHEMALAWNLDLTNSKYGGFAAGSSYQLAINTVDPCAMVISDITVSTSNDAVEPEPTPDSWTIIGAIGGTAWNYDFPMTEKEDGIWVSDQSFELKAGDMFKCRNHYETLGWADQVGGGKKEDGGEKDFEVTEAGTYYIQLDAINRVITLIPVENTNPEQPEVKEPITKNEDGSYTVLGTADGIADGTYYEWFGENGAAFEVVATFNPDTAASAADASELYNATGLGFAIKQGENELLIAYKHKWQTSGVLNGTDINQIGSGNNLNMYLTANEPVTLKMTYNKGVVEIINVATGETLSTMKLSENPTLDAAFDWEQPVEAGFGNFLGTMDGKVRSGGGTVSEVEFTDKGE